VACPQPEAIKGCRADHGQVCIQKLQRSRPQRYASGSASTRAVPRREPSRSLSGAYPRTPLDELDFTIAGEVEKPKRWTWEEFRALPSETIIKDIHCVTRWSKLDTNWEGVSIDTLLDEVSEYGDYVIAFSPSTGPSVALPGTYHP
jgi:DMSO/TMAO reductase YedYZ molybdopterin-dependent catalytic subunit